MKRPTSRSSHSWISIVLAVPMLLVAITAVMMAHSRTLKLGEIRVPTRLFPGYSGDALRATRADLKFAVRAGDGTTLLGTRAGAYRLANETLVPIRGLETMDIKAVAVAPRTGTPLVGTRDGIYRIAGDSAELARKGDIHSIVTLENGDVLAVPVGKDAVTSADGGNHWLPVAEYARALATLPLPEPPTTVALSRLALDIHTGAAFIGRANEWIWIDVIGGVLAFLVATGAWLWWVARRRQAALVRQQVTTKRWPKSPRWARRERRVAQREAV